MAPTPGTRVAWAGSVSRRLAVAVSLLAAGCSCDAPLGVVIATPSATWDGGAFDGDAPWSFPDEGLLEDVPRRCFGDAPTAVVGPYPGCAELEVSGDGPSTCAGGLGDDALPGTPVRIVRRGAALVRLKVLPRCAGAERCEGLASWVFPTVAIEGSERFVADCHACDSDLGGHRTFTGELVGAGTTNPDLGFAANAIDDTVELVVAGADVRYVVQACAVSPNPTQARHLEDCRRACDTWERCGGRSAQYCRARCEDLTVLEGEACLEARVAAFGCIEALGCASDLGVELRGGEEVPACGDELLRVEYECRAS